MHAIHVFCLFCIALLLSPVAAAQAPAADVLATLVPERPRLLANQARFRQLAQQNDTVSVQLRALVKAGADHALAAGPIAYGDHLGPLDSARETQLRIVQLSMEYRLGGDRRYADRARDLLMQLAARDTWSTGPFLSVAENALAAAIGYDWLFDVLSDGEKQRLTEAIAEKALRPGLAANEAKDSWVNGSFNWNPICHGSLMAAALAIAEREPELARRVVQRGLKYIPTAGAAYSPDGAYSEGTTYWTYGTTFYALAVDILRSNLGSSFGLEKIPGFLKTADYKRQMTGPTGLEFNYSDTVGIYPNHPPMMWFARETGRPELIVAELRDIGRVYAAQIAASAEGRLTDFHRHTAFELLWWTPALLDGAVTQAQAPLHWTADGEMPIAVMRSSWTDPHASFIAVKGGSPNQSHGHMDAGSFVLEADGVRWAIDPGREDYSTMVKARIDRWNYAQDSSRWSTFRLGSEGHNIPRIDQHAQVAGGHATIAALPARKGAVGNTVDLTSLYSSRASTFQRTVRLHADRSMSISDSWTLKEHAATVSFQWLTHARVDRVKGGVLLTQDGKALKLLVAPANAAIRIDDVSAPPGAQNSQNPGLKRIVFMRTTGARKTDGLLVRALPQNAQ